MFRRGEKATVPSAADAERQALFEKLAQRPETVCPFLGLAADRSDYEAQATDEHRCYAFGEPEPVSGEQQRNVCLQRGYANCPRYLRGVLVIPTDELEALRRPQQRVPPPPPPPVAAAGSEGGGRRRIAVALLLLLLLVGGGVGAWWFLAGPGGVAQNPTPTPGSSQTASAPGPSRTAPQPTPGASPVTRISGIDRLEPTGFAMRTEDALRLTPSGFQSAGAAWFPQLVVVGDGFTAEFSFRLSEYQGDGGDGLAFVVQPDSSAAVGGIGGGIGYGGLERSLAVEFDTFLNAWPGAPDPNDNHVSVQTNGSGPNGGDHVFSRGVATAIPNLSDQAVHTVRIVYRVGTLTVFIDGAEVLEVSLDLAAELTLDGGMAYVGLTASTGDSAQATDLLTLDVTLP